MASQVNGRSFFTHKPEPATKPETKKEESKRQVTILAQAKITESPEPSELSSDDEACGTYVMLVQQKPIKDIDDDDIWSKDDPWFKELQRLQEVLNKALPGRSPTCEYAKLDWSLPPDYQFDSN